MRSTNCICIHKTFHSLILPQFCSSIVIHIEGLIFSCFYYHICPSSFDRIANNKMHFLSIVVIESILFQSIFHWLHLIFTFRHCRYYMYYTMWLNKHYFIVRGLDVVFFNYPHFSCLWWQSNQSINSQVVGRLCFFRVVGPMLACLELHV
jgi:hypothetical protein